MRLFFVGGPETSRRGCEQHGKSYLIRRRRGEEGGGGGSLTGGAIPSAYSWAWCRWYSRVVEVSVRIEVAAGSQRPQLQDHLDSNPAPACAGRLHSVSDHVPARPFDDAGGAMEHRRRLPDVLGCVDDVDYHTVASTPYTAALARSSCVWAPSLSATHRGAQPAPCRRSSPGGVLPGAAASARLRRPPRPDRQPSPGCVDRGVLAGACGLTPDPAGAARVRVRSHSSAGLRPNRGRLWPQRRRPRLLHTASGRGKRRCGPWLASLNTPATAASHVPRTSSSLRPSQRHLLSHGTVPNAARMSRVRRRGGPKRPGVVIRPGWLLWLPENRRGRMLSPRTAHLRGSARERKRP